MLLGFNRQANITIFLFLPYAACMCNLHTTTVVSTCSRLHYVHELMEVGHVLKCGTQHL